MAMLNHQMVKTIHFWCFDNFETYDMSTLSTLELQRIRNSHGGKQPWLFLVGGTRHISSMNQSQSVELPPGASSTDWPVTGEVSRKRRP